MKVIIHLLAVLIFCGTMMISCESAGESEEYVILAGRVTEADTTIYLSGVIVSDGTNSAIVDTTDERGYFQLREISKAKHIVLFEKNGYDKKEFEIEYKGKLQRPLLSHRIILSKEVENQEN
ncbi:MAG: carboxypeptidase-like regulatory domain-containing protein [candidate division Zixibacteria bacterium]|nr:carboxypeptidase-like regulatory domain-containing protein [candidate division Zixibacteria bacterium]